MFRKNPDAVALAILGLILLPLHFVEGEGPRSVFAAHPRIEFRMPSGIRNGMRAERIAILNEIRASRETIKSCILDSVRTTIHSILNR